MKEYIWQRLYKIPGSAVVLVEKGEYEKDLKLNIDDDIMEECGLIWLCPKPVKVLRRWGEV